MLVKDINPGSASSNPYPITVASGSLYFSADDGIHGQELWKSGGTAASTILVQDIWPGAQSSKPYGLTDLDGQLYFSAKSPDSGRELWRTAGTAATTVQVFDLRPGVTGSSPARLTNIDGTHFSADDGVHGDEAWVLRPETTLSTSRQASSVAGLARPSAVGAISANAADQAYAEWASVTQSHELPVSSGPIAGQAWQHLRRRKTAKN